MSILNRYELNQTILNPNPTPNFDSFGSSVAIEKKNILVGAPTDVFKVQKSGSAYLFDTDGNLRRTFLNPEPREGDQFGQAVDINDGLVTIGAPGVGAGTGIAYLFNETGTLLQSFSNPTPANFDNFGASIAIGEGIIAIGTPGDDNGGSEESGASYLFNPDNGGLLGTILNPNPNIYDGFGSSVAIDGNKLLIGASGRGGTVLPGSSDGAAYLFDISTGDLLQTFLNPSPHPMGLNENFGLSVDLDGNYVLVGARGDRNNGQEASGAAYLFDTRTGELLHTVVNPTSDAVDFFADSVSIAGNEVLIGAPLDNTVGINNGAAYLFDANTGNILQTLFEPEANVNYGFGDSVDNETGKLLVGAANAEVQDASGAVYLFTSVSITQVPEFSLTFSLLLLGTLGASSVIINKLWSRR